MRKKVILFLLSLLIPILSFSEDTYPQLLSDSLVVITPSQLKTTNLIFLEHRKFKLENEELRLQTAKYKQLYSNCLVMDSINSTISEELKAELLIRDEELRRQMQTVSRQKKQMKAITIGGVTISVALLLFIICR